MTQSTKPGDAESGQTPLTFRVEGMDCASCAGTIQTALSRLPGVSDLKVSVTREIMSLTLEDNKTPVGRIEDTVRRLGFVPTLMPARPATQTASPATGGHVAEHAAHVHDPGCSHDHAAPGHGDADHDHTDHHEPDRHDHAGHDHAGHAHGDDGHGQDGNAAHDHAAQASHDHPETPAAAMAPAAITESAPAQKNSHAGHGHDHGSSTPGAIDRPWWQSGDVRQMAIGAILIVVSYAIGRAMPGYGNYAFSLSTLIMLAPIARQAFVTASLGAPFTIQMLMTLAAIGAVIIGEPEEAAIVVLLFSLGELLEGVAAAQARSGIKALGALIPKTAMIEDAGKIREVAADSLTIGQVVVARPGDRIPADGVVIDGISSVDESPMTGESIPVPKEKDSRVFAGSINQDAALRIRVDRAPQDNTIARIILLVEEAQDAKAPTERFIDTFSRYYMPAIVALAALVAILPPLIGLGSWEMWIYRGLALLLIGCPCALVISVPAAIASSLSSAARHGMLLKGGAILETLAKAEMVAFDKTGTLTIGKPVVTDVVALDGNDKALLGLAAAIERESSHPLATAIAAHADTEGADALTSDSVRAVPGRGMEGVWNGQKIFIGAPRFAGDAGTVPAELLDRILALETDGKTVAVIMAGGSAKGLIALRDEPRPDAIAGLAALTAQNIGAIMLSGDNARTAAAIGQKLGIEARGEMLPETKVEAIREMAESHTVVMVGDGINDAPALAAASVGIAIGSGTDVAMEAADAALMRNDIRDVARMIGLARATMRNIRQNVAIALGLKAVFLVTTVIGLSGLWLAVFADTGATVLVTLNAMRLLGYLKAEKA